MSTPSLAGVISEARDVLNELVKNSLLEGTVDSTSKLDDSQFDSSMQTLKLVFDKIVYDGTIDKSIFLGDEKEDKLMKEVDAFNDGLQLQLQETVTATAFQLIVETILEQHLQMYLNPNENSEKIQFHNYKIPYEQFNNFKILSNILDFLVYLYLHGIDHAKKVFYETLSQIARFLFAVTTSQVDIFWYYIESRQDLIATRIFDQKAISDRISMLEICNHLNDKFLHRNSQGKILPEEKDTFNDKFHFRVRTFITSLLAFDDNTGLNKYFTTANYKVPELNKINQDFLEDIIAVQKLFNDPYYYLKRENSRQLEKLVQRLLNVYNYILSEEERWDGSKSDQFAVLKPKSEQEQNYLIDKYSNLQYFPENFWDTMTNSPLSDDDIAYYMNMFMQSKTRYIFLMQIFGLANLYFELYPRNKREFIDSIKANTNVKHITDESLVSDSHKSCMYKIKREIVNRLRRTDTQFAFLIQHICVSEKIWWSWLIHGKDPITNKPLFDDKELTEEELRETKDKFDSLFPFKNKKYHNTYITPQLTRKMRTERGLERLKIGKPSLEKFDQQFNDFTSKLQQQIDSERSEIIESRNTILWKKLKSLRQNSWFTLNEKFSKDIINGNDVPVIPKGIKRTSSQEFDSEIQPESKRLKT